MDQGSGGAHGSKLFLTRLAEPPGSTPLEKIHNELVAHLLRHEDAKVLSILGLEVKEKSLQWMYHGREFCVTDTEHILCKLSIICKNNHTSRNTSLTPIASRTDCWPRRLLECLAKLVGNEKPDREVLDEFMRVRVAFNAVMLGQSLPRCLDAPPLSLLPPRHILFSEELVYWRACPKFASAAA